MAATRLKIRTVASIIKRHCIRRHPLSHQLQENGDAAADNRQSEGDTDTVTLNIFGGHGADLGPHGGADEHDDGSHQFRAALIGIGGGTV